MEHLKTVSYVLVVALSLFCGPGDVFAQVQIEEMNPTSSTLTTSDPNGASGGRIQALARANATTYYAASEWSGLYKSTDTGRTWVRLDAHLPLATWDVEVSPADSNRVIATSFYDGRVASRAGINVSIDGGKTWSHPSTAVPAAAFCADAARREEPSAFGISFDPANAANVYIGTNCGLAISNDAGITWRFVDPTPTNAPDDIWDVIVHHGGVIDLCGEDGHRRSTNGGSTWTTATSSPLPAGRCSLAASPTEAYVLFAVAGELIFESDNGGRTWNTEFVNQIPQGRVPFVATNARGGASFDLWFGDVKLFRAACTTPSPAVEGGRSRCPASSTWTSSMAGAHDDVGDIVFVSGSPNACPALFASDGGVFFNARTASPACHSPQWRQPQVTPRGLWLFGMGGARRPARPGDDLYLGAQDNGTFASVDGGQTWKNIDCCDSFDDVASADRVVYTTCCFEASPQNRIFAAKPGMVQGAQLSRLPPGAIEGWRAPDALDRWSQHGYVAVTRNGVFITSDIRATAITWTRLGATGPAGACAVRVAGNETSPTFIVQSGQCSGRSADALWAYSGTTATGTWRRIQPAAPATGFAIFAVHRSDPTRLAAAQIRPTGPVMSFSSDGGTTWRANTALDTLMTGNGQFRSRTRRGPLDFAEVGPYVQPTLVAFDPADANTVIAGAADAGVFLSRDGGSNWMVVTNSAGSATAPILPRPSFAYFSRSAGVARIFVGTQGRGLWRLQYSLAGPAIPTTPPQAAARQK